MLKLDKKVKRCLYSSHTGEKGKGSLCEPNILYTMPNFNVNHIHRTKMQNNQYLFIQMFIITRNILGRKNVQKVYAKALASLSDEDVTNKHSICWKSSLFSMQKHYQLIPVQWPCRTFGDHGQLRASASFHLRTT